MARAEWAGLAPAYHLVHPLPRGVGSRSLQDPTCPLLFPPDRHALYSIFTQEQQKDVDMRETHCVPFCYPE